MFPILNARLGAGGRYRAYPPRVPVESRYFTLMFVNIGTVTVLDSGREVRVCADTENTHHAKQVGTQAVILQNGGEANNSKIQDQETVHVIATGCVFCLVRGLGVCPLGV